MSYRPALRAASVAAFSLLLCAAAAMPASAAAADSAALDAAMQRDLGLTAAQSAQRLAAESAATTTEQALVSQLGRSYAGSWFDAATGKLVVATTDANQHAAIAAAGATPQVAQRSAADLNRIQAKLDAASAKVTDDVTGWYVDTRSGTVVVEATNPAAAQSFATAAGVGSAVTVAAVAERPQTMAPLVGGDAIYRGGGRCSVGFSGRNGAGTTFMITAGHCTEGGGSWAGSNRTNIGPVTNISFPGDDFGAVRVDNTAAWQGSSQVRGTSSVLGSTQSAVGTSTCRSGSTTGYRCGTVQAFNQTVNYGGGDIVNGLTRTNACAEPGDSGGSFVSGRQAQGMTSGGSGNCRTGGTTFHQPINEALSRLGLSLVVG